MDKISPEELERAAERVREISRRANEKTHPHTMPPTPDFVNVGRHTANVPPMQNSPPVPVKKPSAANSLFRMINFKNLEIDSDVSLILGILLLLSSDKTDEILSMALLYVML